MAGTSGGRRSTWLEVATGAEAAVRPAPPFKPLTLATAIDFKIATLGSRFTGPSTLTLDTSSGPWTVSNFGGESFGSIDLTTATEHSVNTAYAQLMVETGPNKVVATARRLGVASPLQPNPSLVLGTSEVSPVDLATAYSTFGRDGRRIDAHIIGRVEDPSGTVIYAAKTGSGKQVIRPGTARAVNHALQAVVQGGTGTAAQLGRPVAGKTGTTQDYGDAWFAGYTPNYTAVVWMGYPEGPSHHMDDVHGRAVTGGSFPAQIWKRFMDAALVGVPEQDFPEPPGRLIGAPDEQPKTPSTTPAHDSTTTVPLDTTTTSSAPPTSTTSPPPPSTTTTGAPPPTSTTTEPPITSTTLPGGTGGTNGGP